MVDMTEAAAHLVHDPEPSRDVPGAVAPSSRNPSSSRTDFAVGEPISSPPLAADQGAGAEAPIDQAHLARMTLGDERLKAEVLALFDRQASILLARMRQAPASTVGAFAHTLKGSARGIGAWRVAAAAEAVERDAAKQGAADMADTLDRLAAAVAQVRAATQDVLIGR